MSPDSAVMLKQFFAISPGEIARDVADAERNWDKVLADASAKLAQQRDDRDAEAVAKRHHEQLVRAKVIQSQAAVPEPCRLYYAMMAAERIAEEAVTVAYGSGRLSELGRQMDEIHQREGLSEDEYWPRGTGPEDYQKLSNESEELYEKVYDTVVTTVLRRYLLGDVAKRYENDRERFLAQVEEGRKMIFEDRVKE
jgi:hypothetical protein